MKFWRELQKNLNSGSGHLYLEKHFFNFHLIYKRMFYLWTANTTPPKTYEFRAPELSAFQRLHYFLFPKVKMICFYCFSVRLKCYLGFKAVRLFFNYILFFLSSFAKNLKLGKPQIHLIFFAVHNPKRKLQGDVRPYVRFKVQAHQVRFSFFQT